MSGKKSNNAKRLGSITKKITEKTRTSLWFLQILQKQKPKPKHRSPSIKGIDMAKEITISYESSQTQTH